MFKSALEQGGRNLPLLVLLILPFYSLPNAEMRIIQMQFFQLGGVVAFLLAARKFRIPVTHPFCLLPVLGLFQLIVCPIDGMGLFHIQQMIIAFMLFEAAASSGVSFKALRAVVLFFVAVTFLFSLNQAAGMVLPLPGYLTVQASRLIQGIWTGQAYCGAFCAIASPFVLAWRSRLKWAVLSGLFLVILQTHSSFAEVAFFVVVMLWLLARDPRAFAFFLVPAVVYVVGHYALFEKGDFSGEIQRFFIWKQAAMRFLEAPLFGHGFGSFNRFGFENLMLDTDGSQLYFPTAHNEGVQVSYEAGILGLMLYVGLWARVALETLKNWREDEVLACGLSVIAFLMITLGQPIMHAPNIVIFGIFALAVFENRLLNRKGKTC